MRMAFLHYQKLTRRCTNQGLDATAYSVSYFPTTHQDQLWDQVTSREQTGTFRLYRIFSLIQLTLLRFVLHVLEMPTSLTCAKAFYPTSQVVSMESFLNVSLALLILSILDKTKQQQQQKHSWYNSIILVQQYK